MDAGRSSCLCDNSRGRVNGIIEDILTGFALEG